jgi:RNA polymerase sporulation-specific sigma factor
MNTANLYSLSDEDLVELAQKGNEDAKDILYLRYKSFIRAKAYPYFLMGADKEDLVQEGIWGLLNAIQRFDRSQSASFRSFLNICVTGAIFTAIKKAASDKNLPLNTYISLYAKPTTEYDEVQLMEMIEDKNTPSPEELAIQEEQTEKFFKDMSAMLSLLEMNVLKLFLQGFSYKEISSRLKKSTKSVDNALQRIRGKLAHYLEKAKSSLN